jgi:predicted amidohydrolase YtcJ
MSRVELAQALREVVGFGLQPAIHAIGDRALDNVLGAAEEVGLVGINSFRIEHASVVRDDQLGLITKLRPGISIQPHFILTDWWVVKRVGLERVRFVYRFKTLLNLNLVIGLSTDAPVEPVNPWETVYAAVTRGCLDSIELCRYTEDEGLTLTEALHLYTTGSAELLRDEEVGSLGPGKLADIVVVDRDPFKISDLKELRNVSTVKVFVGAEEVY